MYIVNNTTNEAASSPVTPSYVVVDGRTGKAIGKPYSSYSKALARVDRLDNTYGAYRYTVRAIKSADAAKSMTSNQVVLASLEHAYRNRDCR